MPPETLTKEFFAERYGFTEEMTDESSLDAVNWWPRIAKAKHDAEAKRQRDAQRQARH
jgi:hypothetical protein